MFTLKLVNRLHMPTKHVLICEDDVTNQGALLGVFERLFGHQGHVQVSVVPGAFYAYAMMHSGALVDLILLDHDMPTGDGVELLRWMKTAVLPKLNETKVITASGIQSNNDRLMAAGADYKFVKAEIVGGLADKLLVEILGERVQA